MENNTAYNGKLDNTQGNPTTENLEESSRIIPELEKLRLSQNFSDMVGVKKALLTIPVRKPSRQD